VAAFRQQTGITLVRDAANSNTSWDLLGARASDTAADSRYGGFSIYVVKSDLALTRSVLLTGPDGNPIKPDGRGIYWGNGHITATREFGRNIFVVSIDAGLAPGAWKRLNAVVSRIAQPVIAPKPVPAAPDGSNSGSSSWSPSGLDELLAWLSVPISAGLALLVVRHADKHGSRHVVAWGTFTFLAAWLVVPIYVVRQLARR
jgi:hypothetical protein